MADPQSGSLFIECGMPTSNQLSLPPQTIGFQLPHHHLPPGINACRQHRSFFWEDELFFISCFQELSSRMVLKQLSYVKQDPYRNIV